MDDLTTNKKTLIAQLRMNRRFADDSERNEIDERIEQLQAEVKEAERPRMVSKPE